MTARAETLAGGAMARTVSTTDLLKAAALVFVFIDHGGHYFAPDEIWWRVVGRASLPVWFFLIGFARSRTTPWTWIGLGVLLSLLDLWREGSLAGAQLSILLNFAAIRLALPAIERHVWARAWRIALLVAALAALSPVANQIVEYGTEGWLLALVGLAHRHWLETPERRATMLRIGLALVAGLLFVVVETQDYGFEGVEIVALALIVLAVSGMLFLFRRADLEGSMSGPLAALLRFCGRHSLTIYATQIVIFTALAAIVLEDSDESEE
jgi:peptidoglycan/LPS O-acetylase OafA/YrhL